MILGGTWLAWESLEETKTVYVIRTESHPVWSHPYLWVAIALTVCVGLIGVSAGIAESGRNVRVPLVIAASAAVLVAVAGLVVWRPLLSSFGYSGSSGCLASGPVCTTVRRGPGELLVLAGALVSLCAAVGYARAGAMRAAARQFGAFAPPRPTG